MTKKEKYDLAKKAIQLGLKKGAQEVRVSVFDSVSSSIEVRDKKIDKLEQANQTGLGIKFMVDRKFSAHTTNRLNNQKDLESFISEAVIATRYLSEDEFRKLPDPDLYYSGGGKDLRIFDKEFRKIDVQNKINCAFDLEKEVLGQDQRIISVTASYFDGMSSSVMVTSNGFEGDHENSYYGINASVSVNGEDARPQSSWGESALYYNNLEREGVGRIALKRALSMIGQTKIESEKLPVIVENRIAGQLLSPLISALGGSAIQQKNSFLINKLDEKVGSKKLSIVDNPFIPAGRGSRYFDSEGLQTKKRSIFEKGILKNYFLDTYYAKKLEMSPTSGSTTNLIVEPGEKSLDEMVSSLDRGILVSGFNGGNTNGSTGDFSYGIEGFLIINGIIVKPVSEMNISGNMMELWKSLIETGCDPYLNSSWRIPSMMFLDIDFSGK